MPGGPVIVGTSVLAAKPKAPKLSVPSASSGLSELLSGTAPSATNPILPNAGLAAILKAATANTATSAKDNSQTFGTLPDTNLGATYAQILGHSSGATATNPTVGLGAALQLARKELGGFDASPYDQAIAAIQGAAGSSQSQAQKQAAQAEADDAALYGRLGNFVNDTAKAGNKDNKQAGKQIGKTYGAETDQLNQLFGNTDNAAAAAMARLGINPDTATGGGKEDEQFLLGEAASNKANAQSNNKSSGSAFDQLMQETKGDTRATGSADVASEKSGLNTTLASIAQQLGSQLASVNESKATAQDSYRTQLRQAAMSLLTQEQAQSPSNPANILKSAQAAEAEANALAKEKQLQTGGSTAGEDPFTKALGAIQAAAPNLAPGREATAEDWLKRAELGELGNSGEPSKLTAFANAGGLDTKTLPGVLQQLQKVYSQHPGFGAPAQNALEQALQILARGK